MNAFVNAVKQVPDATTENGALTFSTTLSANTDFFFKAGASRQDVKGAVSKFEAAFREDAKLAIRNLLWARDVREGAGERNLFRQIVKVLKEDVKLKLVPFVAEFGRWDDLIPFIEKPETESGQLAITIWGFACNAGDGLACKWAPRKGEIAVTLRKGWGMTPKSYRQMIVLGSNTVEQKMCAKDWNSINFEHVPSVAAARYRKAFEKNAMVPYMAYKEALEKGDAKINASALFPHDITRSLYQGGASESICDAQWKALPNYVTGGNVLCIVDVSSSMQTRVSGSIEAIDIAIGLGIYTAERLTGAFKNTFLTFTSDPDFVTLSDSDTLMQKVRKTKNARWGGSTDFNKAIAAILKLAITNQVPQEDMPKVLLVTSDMEFNQAGPFTNYKALQLQYANAGYEIPTVVFWNVNSRNGNAPVRFDTPGVALISGYSPAILKSVLGNTSASPGQIMLDTLSKDRYSIEGLTL